MTPHHIKTATLLATLSYLIGLLNAAGAPSPPPPPSPYITACPPRYFPRIIHGGFDDIVPK